MVFRFFPGVFFYDSFEFTPKPVHFQLLNRSQGGSKGESPSDWPTEDAFAFDPAVGCSPGGAGRVSCVGYF